jgi:hypothetical protein
MYMYIMLAVHKGTSTKFAMRLAGSVNAARPFVLAADHSIRQTTAGLGRVMTAAYRDTMYDSSPEAPIQNDKEGRQGKRLVLLLRGCPDRSS